MTKEIFDLEEDSPLFIDEVEIDICPFVEGKACYFDCPKCVLSKPKWEKRKKICRKQEY